MIGTAARITPANHLLDATTRRTLGQVLSIVEAGAMLSACPDTRIVVLHRKRLVTPNENKISHRWRGPAFSSPFYFRISLLQFSKRPAVGCIEWLGRLRQGRSSPARRSKTTPNRKGMMNGTAGIPTIKPGLVYHGVALPSGYWTPLSTRNSNATPFTIMNARAAPRPSHWTRPREAANAAVAR